MRGRPCRASDDERDLLGHQSADEVNISREPVELRDDDRTLLPASQGERLGKLGPSVECVCALPTFNLHELGGDGEALNFREPLDRFALGF